MFIFMGIFILIVVLFTWPTSYDDPNEDVVLVENLENETIVEEKIIEDKFSNVGQLHWTHMPLKYKFEEISRCKWAMKNIVFAFEQIENETGEVISFKETTSEDEDIIINCGYIPLETDSFFDYSDTLAMAIPQFGENNTLIYGKLYFLSGGTCSRSGYSSLEMHEIFHLFGIDHDSGYYYGGKPSIMSRYEIEKESQCPKKMRPELVSCLKYIYSNGIHGESCEDINFLEPPELLEECPEETYEVEGTKYCCPEPNMTIIDDYCI